MYCHTTQGGSYAKDLKFISKELRDVEGLSTKEKPKALADGPVVIDILRYLWIHDEYEYPHPRMRLQLAFSILVMHFVGLRPGELVESTAHQGSNEGLLWKDVDIMMIPNREGAPLFVAQLRIRNRKGRRDSEGDL